MRTAIVAFDAGGAEMLAAWAFANGTESYICFCEGPALGIFRRRLGRDVELYSFSDIKATLPRVQRVVTSSNWGSSIEKRVWPLARENGVESVLYVDGGFDFSNTFVLNGVTVLPDRVWITHPLAKDAILKWGISDSNIEVVENFYLRQMKTRVVEKAKGLSESYSYLRDCRILYCTENISACEETYEIRDSGLFRGYNEWTGLESFLRLIESGYFRSPYSVRLRKHPSEPRDKYLNWVVANKELQVEISGEDVSLEDDLAWATQVVGCETTVLAVAVGCDIPAISCIPFGSRISCRLPYPEIIKIEI